MGGLKLNVFLFSSFGIGLKGNISNILFSYFIIALFFRHRVLKFIDLCLSRQAGKFVSFSLSVGDGGGGGYLSGEDGRGGHGGDDAGGG